MTDRRYGANKYGDGALYGTSDARNAYAWDVSIDWDEDGYLETNDADRLVSYSLRRGRTRMMGGFGQGFEPISTGVCTLVFRNDDGRFDAWNTSSPLYPNVNYGKDLRVRIKDLSTGIIHARFYGVITNIEPSGYDQDAVVTITASDGLEYLRNNTARVAMQTDISPKAAMDLVLDAISWPVRWGRDLESTLEEIPYWWSSGNNIALSELQNLAMSFIGYLFVDAIGRVRYIARTNIGTSVADYSQAELMKDFGNPQPYEIRRNITRLKAHPRTKADTGTIWELVGTPPSIGTGSTNTLTVFANYKYLDSNAPAINVITPEATTDYTVNTLADGTGTDLTGSCTVSLTDFGDTAKLILTNNSGSSGYVTSFKVRGDAVYEPSVTDVTYPTNPATILTPRELVFDLIWLQDINAAIDLAVVLGPYYAGLHPTPNIKLSDRPALQFAPELFDIVTLGLERIGLSGESFRVGGIVEATDGTYKNCQSVQTRLYLEPYISSDDYMQWDTKAAWDSTTIFGW